MLFSILINPLNAFLILSLGGLAVIYGVYESRNRLTPEAQLNTLVIENNFSNKLKISDWLFPKFTNEIDDDKYTYGVSIGALILLIMAKFITGQLGLLGFMEVEQYLSFAAFMIFFSAMIILYVIDKETLTMPKNVIHFTTIAAGLLLIGSSLLGGDYNSIWYMFIGGIVTFLFYFLIWFIRPQGIGFSDVRLAFPIGLILGWVSVQTFIVGALSPFFIATLGIIILLPFQKFNKNKKFAFGPSMIFGVILALFYGETIINYISLI